VGIELEVNQKHVVTAGRYWTAMRKVIVESLCRALASRCAGIFDPTTKTAALAVSRGTRP
jgi:hypothetical protein